MHDFDRRVASHAARQHALVTSVQAARVRRHPADARAPDRGRALAEGGSGRLPAGRRAGHLAVAAPRRRLGRRAGSHGIPPQRGVLVGARRVPARRTRDRRAAGAACPPRRGPGPREHRPRPGHAPDRRRHPGHSRGPDVARPRGGGDTAAGPPRARQRPPPPSHRLGRAPRHPGGARPPGPARRGDVAPHPRRSPRRDPGHRQRGRAPARHAPGAARSAPPRSAVHGDARGRHLPARHRLSGTNAWRSSTTAPATWRGTGGRPTTGARTSSCSTGGPCCATRAGCTCGNPSASCARSERPSSGPGPAPDVPATERATATRLLAAQLSQVRSGAGARRGSPGRRMPSTGAGWNQARTGGRAGDRTPRLLGAHRVGRGRGGWRGPPGRGRRGRRRPATPPRRRPARPAGWRGASRAGRRRPPSMAAPSATPSAPPSPASSTDSTRNWVRTWRRVAPSARRTPISARRSSTEMTMTLAMPTPADHQRHAAEAQQQGGQRLVGLGLGLERVARPGDVDLVGRLGVGRRRRAPSARPSTWSGSVRTRTVDADSSMSNSSWATG